MKLYTVISQIKVIGYIWMPGILREFADELFTRKSLVAAYTYKLSDWDIENIRNEDGNFTRVGVELWLDTNSGDFSEIVDFSVTIGDGEFDSGWSHEESEYTFLDCTYGGQDD